MALADADLRKFFFRSNEAADEWERKYKQRTEKMLRDLGLIHEREVREGRGGLIVPGEDVPIANAALAKLDNERQRALAEGMRNAGAEEPTFYGPLSFLDPGGGESWEDYRRRRRMNTPGAYAEVPKGYLERKRADAGWPPPNPSIHIGVDPSAGSDYTALATVTPPPPCSCGGCRLHGHGAYSVRCGHCTRLGPPSGHYLYGEPICEDCKKRVEIKDGLAALAAKRERGRFRRLSPGVDMVDATAYAFAAMQQQTKKKAPRRWPQLVLRIAAGILAAGGPQLATMGEPWTMRASIAAVQLCAFVLGLYGEGALRALDRVGERLDRVGERRG